MTDTFFALNWCLCVNIPFIVPYSDGVTGLFFSRKHCTLPTTLKMGCIFLRINLLKVSCRKRWKCHFRDPKLRNFLGSIPPDLVGWADFGATTFFPRVRTPSQSHVTLLTFISLFV